MRIRCFQGTGTQWNGTLKDGGHLIMSSDCLPKLIFLSPEVEEYLKNSLYSEVKIVNGKVVPPVFFFTGNMHIFFTGNMHIAEKMYSFL